MAEDKRKRLPCGHLFQRVNGYVTFCRICYNKARRAARRALGLPHWAVEERAGNSKHVQAVLRYKRKNPDKSRRWCREWRERTKELYGGDPSRDIIARFKWMQRRATASKP